VEREEPVRRSRGGTGGTGTGGARGGTACRPAERRPSGGNRGGYPTSNYTTIL